MIHCKAMTVVIAFDIYQELCEGRLDADWKMKPVDFFTFREQLAIQMLQYTPGKRQYPGDGKFRVATQQHKKRRPDSPSFASPRKRQKSQGTDSDSAASNISTEDLQRASGRLCGVLDPLMNHLESIRRLPGHNAKVCAVCGKKAYEECKLCAKPLHYKNTQDGMNVPCFFQYHNTSFFGLAKDDSCMVGSARGKFSLPTDDARKQHAEHLKELHNKTLQQTPVNLNNRATEMADSTNGDNSNNTDDQQDPHWRPNTCF